jgi:hypothetical protein
MTRPKKEKALTNPFTQNNKPEIEIVQMAC